LDLFFLILGKEDQDFNFFLEQNREVSRGPFSPDDGGGGPIADCVDDSSRNGWLLKG